MYRTVAEHGLVRRQRSNRRVRSHLAAAAWRCAGPRYLVSSPRASGCRDRTVRSCRDQVRLGQAALHQNPVAGPQADNVPRPDHCGLGIPVRRRGASFRRRRSRRVTGLSRRRATNRRSARTANRWYPVGATRRSGCSALSASTKRAEVPARTDGRRHTDDAGFGGRGCAGRGGWPRADTGTASAAAAVRGGVTRHAIDTAVSARRVP